MKIFDYDYKQLARLVETQVWIRFFSSTYILFSSESVDLPFSKHEAQLLQVYSRQSEILWLKLQWLMILGKSLYQGFSVITENSRLDIMLNQT